MHGLTPTVRRSDIFFTDVSDDVPVSQCDCEAVMWDDVGVAVAVRRYTCRHSVSFNMVTIF